MNEANPDSNLIETLKSLKCIICKHTLSIPPILTISDNEYQCGRCSDIKYVNVAARNLIFERVANYLDFPCIYPDCGALVPWKDVQSHEKDCRFKTITCPMFHEDCHEQISVSELTQHMVKKHGNNIYFENIVIPVPMFKSYVCVISVNSTVFLVYICSDKVIITSVKSNDQTLSYTLKLQSSDQNSPTITFEKQSIEEFNERKHCFRCMDNRCDLKYHPYSTSNRKILDHNKITSTDEAPRMSGKLNKKVGWTKSISLAPTPKNKIWFGLPISQTTHSSTDTEHVFSASTAGTNAKPFNSNTTLNPSVRSTFSSTVANTESVFSASLASTNTFNHNGGLNTSMRSTLPTTIGNVSIAGTNLLKPIGSNMNSSPSFLECDESSPQIKCNVATDTNDSSAKSDNEYERNGIHKFDHTDLQIIKCTKFNLSHIYNLIGVTSSITFTITINTTDETENESSASLVDSFIPRHLLSTIDNSDLLRKTLECPICSEYMEKSIFLCERGHHICNNCKILNSCPSCQGVIQNSRNFALEDLAENISISCSSKEQGCEFRGNLSMISDHEKNCDYNKTDSA